MLMLSVLCITYIPIIIFINRECGSHYYNKRISITRVVQWFVRLTRNMEVVSSSPIKGPRCFLEQNTLTLLFSTGWFQEQIRA